MKSRDVRAAADVAVAIRRRLDTKRCASSLGHFSLAAAGTRVSHPWFLSTVGVSLSRMLLENIVTVGDHTATSGLFL